MNELIQVPESKSPRLLWLEKHDVHTYRTPYLEEDEEPWGAWIGDLDDAIAHGGDCRGRTEDEALVELAKRYQLKLWNEEQHA